MLGGCKVLEKRSDLIPFQFLACSEKWRVVSFPVLSTIAYQLVIMLDSGGLSRVSMLFQFENMGLNEEGFVGMVKGWWDVGRVSHGW